jgi:hypothetical protein
LLIPRKFPCTASAGKRGNDDEAESNRRQSAGIEIRWRKASFYGTCGAYTHGAGTAGRKAAVDAAAPAQKPAAMDTAAAHNRERQLNTNNGNRLCCLPAGLAKTGSQAATCLPASIPALQQR